jgi:hypothetical protein
MDAELNAIPYVDGTGAHGRDPLLPLLLEWVFVPFISRNGPVLAACHSDNGTGHVLGSHRVAVRRNPTDFPPRIAYARYRNGR